MEDIDLIIKVCNLKYREKKQQKEISKILKLSQAKVTRLLQKAIELEIIQFNIVDNKFSSTELESKLEQRFGLKRVLVVKSDRDSESEIKALIGQRVAQYLLNILKDGDVLGISHSSTVSEIINALPMKISKKTEVVQMLGGSYSLTFKGLDKTKELSDKFDVTPHILYAPLFVDDKMIRQAIISDSSIKETFRYMKGINISLVSIGPFYPKGSSTIYKSGALSKKEVEELEKSDVAGDVFGHFFSRKGDFLRTSIEDRLITIPIEYIDGIEYRIAAAGTLKKFDAILAAVKGGLINILATDMKVADRLLGS